MCNDKGNYENLLFPWKKQADVVLKNIQGAKGVYLWDSENKYYDMSSQCVNVNIGHGNEKVIDAINEQCRKLPYIYSTFNEESRFEAARKIIEVTPSNLKKVFFANSGAEANENAIKIARSYTKREKVFSAYQSFHGATMGAGNLSGDHRRLACEPGPSGFVKFNYPDRYHCLIDFKSEKEFADYYVETLRNQIIAEGINNVAAIFIEPIIGGNGVIIPPDGYVQGIRKICDDYGILLICDEVMTGWGRTGKWFAIEHWGVEPDIITTSKGLTCSYFPLGAVVVSKEIADYFDDNLLSCGSTNYAHPVGCAAASATIDVYKENNLIHNSKVMGDLLSCLLDELKEKHNSIGDVRCKGLFSVIEFVKDRQTKEPLGDLSEVMKLLYKKGVWTLNRGQNITIAPPLIIKEEELRDSISILDEVLTELNL